MIDLMHGSISKRAID